MALCHRELVVSAQNELRWWKVRCGRMPQPARRRRALPGTSARNRKECALTKPRDGKKNRTAVRGARRAMCRDGTRSGRTLSCRGRFVWSGRRNSWSKLEQYRVERSNRGANEDEQLSARAICSLAGGSGNLAGDRRRFSRRRCGWSVAWGNNRARSRWHIRFWNRLEACAVARRIHG